MSNGNDGYSFQEMGSEDITGGKKGWRGEDAAPRTKKMQWTWDEQSFEVGGSQKAKEDFEGQMGAFAWSASQSYSRKGFWKVGEDPRAAGTNVWTKWSANRAPNSSRGGCTEQHRPGTRVLQSTSCSTKMAEKSRVGKSCITLSPKRKSTCHHYIRRWRVLGGVGQRYGWRDLSLQDTAKKADAFLQPQSNSVLT